MATLSSIQYEMIGGPFDGDAWRIAPGEITPQVLRAYWPNRPNGPRYLYVLGVFKGVQVYKYEGPA